MKPLDLHLLRTSRVLVETKRTDGGAHDQLLIAGRGCEVCSQSYIRVGKHISSGYGSERSAVYRAGT